MEMNEDEEALLEGARPYMLKSAALNGRKDALIRQQAHSTRTCNLHRRLTIWLAVGLTESFLDVTCTCVVPGVALNGVEDEEGRREGRRHIGPRHRTNAAPPQSVIDAVSLWSVNLVVMYHKDDSRCSSIRLDVLSFSSSSLDLGKVVTTTWAALHRPDPIEGTLHQFSPVRIPRI